MKKILKMILLILLLIIVFAILINTSKSKNVFQNSISKDEVGIKTDYSITNYQNNKFDITLNIEDKENGIKQVKTPNGEIISGNNKNKISIDYNVDISKEYLFEITSTSGNNFTERIYIDEIPIAFKVNIGDFIKYDAGTWTQEEIDLLGDFYAGDITNPENSKFAGFKVGDDRNKTTKAYETEYDGWRVLNKNGAKLQLIHAGIPELFDNGSQWQDVLNNRNLSMYVNEYATDAHFLKQEELPQDKSTAIYKSISLVGSSAYYCFNTKSINNSIIAYGNYGMNYYDRGQAYLGKAFGIRPVVTLKENIRLTGGDGTYSSPYTMEIIK